ncbi:hypothetical protein FDI24_gp017 [Acidovorax phage ACP17]|uniref:Uncharacterized protein n=1 Tax=Acidovorax phage ACP17 TaxID=2010329 RepID=A0A218M3D6_9CAUD|nr:hypothetical protein FDI24_gp017 [Acidovorax phage ACP17]ASD50551.1 hypothetical protein [Acidovorax phage ACP17]
MNIPLQYLTRDQKQALAEHTTFKLEEAGPDSCGFVEVVKPWTVWKATESWSPEPKPDPVKQFWSCERVIVELLLEPGTKLYYDLGGYMGRSPGSQDSRKMRASRAKVVRQHQMERHCRAKMLARRIIEENDISDPATLFFWKEGCEKNFEERKEVLVSSSAYNRGFLYHTGCEVKPFAFSMLRETCEGGIHFFESMYDALHYSL